MNHPSSWAIPNSAGGLWNGGSPSSAENVLTCLAWTLWCCRSFNVFLMFTTKHVESVCWGSATSRIIDQGPHKCVKSLVPSSHFHWLTLIPRLEETSPLNTKVMNICNGRERLHCGSANLNMKDAIPRYSKVQIVVNSLFISFHHSILVLRRKKILQWCNQVAATELGSRPAKKFPPDQWPMTSGDQHLLNPSLAKISLESRVVVPGICSRILRARMLSNLAGQTALGSGLEAHLQEVRNCPTSGRTRCSWPQLWNMHVQSKVLKVVQTQDSLK